MADAQSGTATATLLLADVEGSVRHWEADHEATNRALGRLDEIVAGCAGRFGAAKPLEQGEGDSFILAFGRASEAAACALDLQRAFRKEPWPGGLDIRVRMAVHSGEVQIGADGRYKGSAFNRAARLRALSHGGQVLFTRATHDLAADALPPGAALKDLGQHRLRDLSRPERVYQLCHPDLPEEFPPLRSLNAVPNNLPILLTSFIGREQEMRDVSSLLAETRMLTLTGAGGCGKTRLAAQLAAEIAADYADGVWWVELSSIADPALVAGAVASVLQVRDPGSGADISETLAEELRDRRLLLVLDNCEHLVDACARLAVTLLHHCPSVSILATSREPLGLEGEAAFRVPSLTVPGVEPQTIEDLAPYAASRLFVDRAVRARPNFHASDEHAPAVAQICRRLDGIPLAIELAAARVRMMSPAQIVDALADRFHLLTGGARTALPRQRTLEASVDWSYHLLADDERTIFGRLSVFAGSFDLDAAEAVCGFDGIERYGVLELVGGLVDKSLVQADESPDGTRYRLLETIRAYARHKLADSGAASAARDRHLEHYVRVADRAEPELQGQTLPRWLDRLDTELPNLRAAMDWALASGRPDDHLRIIGSIGMYWLVRARYGEMQRVLHEGLEAAPDAPPLVRVKALMSAISVWFQADFVRCRAYAIEAVGLAGEAGEAIWLSRALMWRGWTEFFLGEGTGLTDLEEAARLARDVGNAPHLSRALVFLGTITAFSGDVARGRSLLREAVAKAEEAADPLMLGQGLTFVGLADYAAGDLARSAEALTTAVEIGRTLRHGAFTAQPLSMLAMTAVYRGELARARSLADEAAQFSAQSYAYVAQGLAEAAGARVELVEGNVVDALARAEKAATIASRTGLVPNVTDAHLIAARAARQLGDFDRAAVCLEKAKNAASRYPFGMGAAALEQAWLARSRGDRLDAERLAHEAVQLLFAGGTAVFVPACLELLGTLAAEAGSGLEAARLLGAASAARDTRGIVLFAIDLPDHEAAVTVCRTALDDADFDAAWEAGRRMSLEEAVAYAERGRGERKRPAAGWEALTPTELDVVQLAARGLSNPQIAERLFISRHTVKVHLSHVFAKLGMASRSELAAEATRRGL